MTDTAEKLDYSKTLYLPETDFPMRAGLPQKEPELVARWQQMDLYKKLRASAAGREKFVLHDGPPYANGNIHIGHALNKILKDVITRSFQMRGYDSNYVPGWDCHGLPIEWKIEEENYRSKGKAKPDLSEPAAMTEFRRECRAYAEKWIKVQAGEFQRLGIVGDFENPYLTMNFHAEARIAGELLKIAKSGQLYRGSKPIMWSVVERTALAEAEVEYQDYESDTIWVKFPVVLAALGAGGRWVDDDDLSKLADDDIAIKKDLQDASVVIWTTTPWTIPGNRAISYSPKIGYGLYEVTAAENDFGPRPGEKLIFADKLAEESFAKAKLQFKRLRGVSASQLAGITCAHPLKGLGGGYEFPVPLLAGDHVTDDAGTGFVHTAPSHGREDFEAWMHHIRELEARGIETKIPFPVDDSGTYTADAPGFEGVRVMDDNGKKGDANDRVIKALIEKNMLFARGRLKHQYPHSWRSKKPIIFRNTPQWFVYMDKPLGRARRANGDSTISFVDLDILRTDELAEENGQGSRHWFLDRDSDEPPLTLRERALRAIDDTRFVPAAGQNRLRAMIEQRPDWVLSRQRAWGVPICVFVDEHGEILQDDDVNRRILDAFEVEGADAWFAEGAKERFLGNEHDPAKWTQVMDILDVWFDSGSTHTFTLEDRPDLKWPADVYLEGSDQHRGWFHSSLLESAATRGRAPYDTVITHGFTMDEKGQKMSKSLGNVVAPQDVMKDAGADILRLWVMTTDYWEDQRLGKTIIQTNVDAYRKLRNTIRWMLGTLAHDEGEEIAYADLPELEKLMLHRLAELDKLVREAYDAFEFKKIARALIDFANVELSAFYFDVRKDALYCDAPSSLRRRAALSVIRRIFDCMVTWLAPMLPFTTEEAWLSRNPGAVSVHLEQFPDVPAEWRNDMLAEKWSAIRRVRSVVTGALEIERKDKRIGSSLEAAPVVHITDPALLKALEGQDFEEICITSGIEIVAGEGPESAFRLPEVPGVAVDSKLAEGVKCARSWRVTKDVGSDPAWPDVSARDAAALRELAALGRLG
ncbi:isoleucine--tRNA ligase [Neorhizobium petrolearium]|uniref:Isoleucine--tRNA ligase n=1 Tax=Neorhizobium petrolearium TaxID=515361 RepID=A0ABY8M3E9_9HYPH|nr:isoleucine--tRNA ligase [Neorhizobium petrolearium]MCC2608673.1 isoleucine--tRNA ligase [Neorhizobium petrolearium]WGI68933.1 isoleucine--tRNA ligase [Neorhizobium petrolearium]